MARKESGPGDTNASRILTRPTIYLCHTLHGQKTICEVSMSPSKHLIIEEFMKPMHWLELNSTLRHISEPHMHHSFSLGLNLSEMDKASLLGRVIDHVKDLKRKVIDTGQGFTIPKDVNHITVEEGNYGNTTTSSEDKNFYIKASICCDDRPDLFVSLIQTFNALKLTTVRADITSLGGRVQNEFILCGEYGDGIVCLSSLKEAIKEALGRIASFDMASSDSTAVKRQRLLKSHYNSLSP